MQRTRTKRMPNHADRQGLGTPQPPANTPTPANAAEAATPMGAARVFTPRSASPAADPAQTLPCGRPTAAAAPPCTVGGTDPPAPAPPHSAASLQGANHVANGGVQVPHEGQTAVAAGAARGLDPCGYASGAGRPTGQLAGPGRWGPHLCSAAPRWACPPPRSAAPALAGCPSAAQTAPAHTPAAA